MKRCVSECVCGPALPTAPACSVENTQGSRHDLVNDPTGSPVPPDTRPCALDGPSWSLLLLLSSPLDRPPSFKTALGGLLPGLERMGVWAAGGPGERTLTQQGHPGNVFLTAARPESQASAQRSGCQGHGLRASAGAALGRPLLGTFPLFTVQSRLPCLPSRFAAKGGPGRGSLCPGCYRRPHAQ